MHTLPRSLRHAGAPPQHAPGRRRGPEGRLAARPREGGGACRAAGATTRSPTRLVLLERESTAALGCCQQRHGPHRQPEAEQPLRLRPPPPTASVVPMMTEMSRPSSYSISSEWMQAARRCRSRAGLEQRLRQPGGELLWAGETEETGWKRASGGCTSGGCASGGCSTCQQVEIGLLDRQMCSVSSTSLLGMSCERRCERRSVG